MPVVLDEGKEKEYNEERRGGGTVKEKGGGGEEMVAVELLPAAPTEFTRHANWSNHLPSPPRYLPACPPAPPYRDWGIGAGAVWRREGGGHRRYSCRVTINRRECRRQ
ncbi:hypothetical protein Pcinc_031809 [Petrolisthes cinctipes]|uniref:Uncharacterized protein n=1 Tax=Petrolisthes cinctipes TaxID=88211 RepID=A0AAE1K225_PETCI|nr:hypothetical protein Pcinc_031809 [Petrolisthes cinctipes]